MIESGIYVRENRNNIRVNSSNTYSYCGDSKNNHFIHCKLKNDTILHSKVSSSKYFLLS